MTQPTDTGRCALCDGPLPSHGFYVVRMDVFAEPSLPGIDAAELADADYAQEMQKLIDQMAGLGPDDLQDQVHRRLEYRLCPRCHPRFLANPLGLPRRRAPGDN